MLHLERTVFHPVPYGLSLSLSCAQLGLGGQPWRSDSTREAAGDLETRSPLC